MKIFNKIYNLILGLTLFATITVNAQDATPLPAALFTEIQMDARAAAMGGTSNITQSSSFGVFSNASANLFAKERLNVGTALSAPANFSGNKLFSLGSYYNLNENHGVSFGVRYYNYPTINILDIDGAGSEKFAPKEMTADLGYGYKINDQLAVSVTGRYIHSNMGSFEEAKPAQGFAADMGITYITDLHEIESASLAFALTANNFGTQLKYLDEAIALPSSINFGSSVDMPFTADHQLSLTLHAGYRVLPTYFKGATAGIGAEYNLFKHGFLRAGYHFSDSEKGLGNFTTWGGGIQFHPVKVDIAFWTGVPNQKFKSTLFINLGIAL